MMENPLLIGTLAMIYIFVLAIFTGVEVISRVRRIIWFCSCSDSSRSSSGR